MAALTPYPAYGNVRIVGPVSAAPPGIFTPQPVLFRQPIQQFLMDAAETAVAHHRDVIAGLCGFHHHIRQRIDISTPVSRLYAGVRHF